MLDKSIPYKSIIMKMPWEGVRALLARPEPSLPAGFTWRFYQPGDIKNWAAIETSVLEFNTQQDAEAYFAANFLPEEKALACRGVYILDEKGRPVATATAWYMNSAQGHQAALHWVAVRPECQGLGLGKAVVLLALRAAANEEPEQDVWLHTQTWSHVAVKLYHKLGFAVQRRQTLADSTNEYEEAMALLRQVEDEDFVKALVAAAQ